MPHDFQALYDAYPAVIARMDPTFTSHQFILELARLNQADYIEALYAYKDDEPFRKVHQILSSRFNSPVLSEMIESDGDEPNSRNIFNQPMGCSRWRKK